MTMYDILKNIAKFSEDVYLYDFDLFNKEFDIHRLYKGVKGVQNVDDSDLSDLVILNKEMEFRGLELRKVEIEYFGEKLNSFGLTCIHNGILICDMHETIEKYFDRHIREVIEEISFERHFDLSEKEFEYAEVVANCILDLFVTYGQYDLVFFAIYM